MKIAAWKRILSFSLCFVLLLSIVPFRANAVGVDWIFRQVGTDIGTAAILEGLGISRDIGSTDNDFNDLITRIKNALADAGMASLDYLDAYYSVSTAGPMFAFPLSLISFVRNWVFDNGVVNVENSPHFGFDVSGRVASMTVNASSTKNIALVYAYYIYRGNARGEIYAISTEPFRVTADTMVSAKDGVFYGYYYAASVAAISTTIPIDTHLPVIVMAGGGTDDLEAAFGSPIVPSLVPSGGIQLSNLALPSVPFSIAYPEWLQHDRTLSNGTTETLVQIGLGNTLEETEDLTQEQIWSGLGSIQIPEQDQTQGTLLDILQSIVQLPTQIVGSIQTALQSFFQLSGEATDYAIQLRDFFPFCIPFDLFDFITVLSAEPEAPVFHWEIPVPQLGQTFELEVDLSAWDEIAILFRNLELLAFIFGLAIMTREKFLRS